MTGSIRWLAIKLAIFTVFTIVITILLASVIGNFQLFSSPYEIEAEFTDATGLLKGDVVKAAGVTVGRVESIQIDNGIAVVTMSIREHSELPSGLRAQIRFRNLLGQRMITLTTDAETSTTELAADGERIPLDRTDPAFDLTVLFNGLRPLIRSTDPADINIVTTSLTEALKGRSDEVEAFLGNLADISDTLASKDDQLTTLLRNVNVVTEDLSGRDAQLRRTLSNLNSFLTDVAASKVDLAAALTTLDEAATRLGRIVAANDDNIRVELADLAILLDAVNDKRADLRAAVRQLPNFTLALERVSSYGEWGNIHLIDVCKDDFGTCGTRASKVPVP